MACPDISVIQEAACDSGIWQVDDEIELLRLIAQSAANWIVALVPGTDITPAAVEVRACISGIWKADDEIALYRIIGQNLCNTIT